MTSQQPIAVVTGASRGIGRAVALELVGNGYRVFALARSGLDLEDLASLVPEGEIAAVVADVADDESREAAVDLIMDATGGYGTDVLVNNAGYGQLGPSEEVSLERVRRQFEVNVIGALALSQAFLPAMRERRRGTIVNMSSAAGRIATPFMGVYCSSKFALEALSDSLRVEVAPFGVRVVLIEPGPIRTQFGAVADGHADAHPDSPYAPFLRGWSGTRGGAYQLMTRSPDAVARVVARAIATQHPRARYTVTLPARAGTLARRLVPDKVLDWFFLRAIQPAP